jgi:hypothetical protein
MSRSKNKEVQTFLDDLKIMEGELYDMVAELRKMILDTHQQAEEKIMYGGIVFFLDGEMFGGIFSYKNHVSLEFSNGSKMNDPDNHLEGKGKFRRHLKIRTREDIAAKQAAFYIKQATY